MLIFAWYIAPYKLRAERFFNGCPIRYCAMDDFTKQIIKEKGSWVETEVEGDRAIVKVSASEKVLAELDKVFERLPDDFMTNTISKTAYFKPRIKPRYDKEKDKIIFDGEAVAPVSLSVIDTKIK